ncbi:MAG: type 1 fimbrial protein [Neisseriaceae bacterium]|nr:type 1 fimbrial protein [Neisseriaceae bacterium]MBP6861752.1 type 1 fimbrial protein [Neisseriaceae bacterium]
MNHRSLIYFFLGLSGFASAASVPDEYVSGSLGTVHIVGTLVSSTCSLRMDSLDQSIDLGAISAAVFQQAGARSAGVPIRLRFSDCLLGASERRGPVRRAEQFSARADGVGTDLFLNGQYGITVTLLGEPDGANPQLLKVGGDARGVGVRFTDQQGRAINLNQVNQAYVLNPGENLWLFYAGLESTQAGVRSGEFQSVVNVRVSYL